MATVTQTRTQTTKMTTTIKPKQRSAYHRQVATPRGVKAEGKSLKYKRVRADLKPLVSDSGKENISDSGSEEEPFFHRGTYIAARYGRTSMKKTKSNSERTYVIDDLSEDEDLDLIMPGKSARLGHQFGSCCACTCTII